MQEHTYCGYCGSKCKSDSWPRTCGACEQVTWRNPLPVVVAVVTIGNGVLLVRRNIQPGLGKLALPGGFLDYGETWQEGTARELREETGLEVHPSLFELTQVSASANRRCILVFARTPALCHLQSDDVLANFEPNKEVSELVVSATPVELAFQTHTDVLRQHLDTYFPGRS